MEYIEDIKLREYETFKSKLVPKLESGEITCQEYDQKIREYCRKIDF